MLEEELAAYLAANVPAVSSRIYPMRLPQGVTLPAITYLKVSGVRKHSLTGPAGSASPRMQVSCWGATYGAAKNLASLVRIAIDGYRGTMGAIEVGAILLLNEMDLIDPEPGFYQVILDFEVIHRE